MADQRLDHNDNRECIDVLIGSDFYWDVVTGERVQGTDGPLTVSNVFGWLQSGPISVTGNGEGYTTTILIVQGSDAANTEGSCEMELYIVFGTPSQSESERH